MSEHPSDYMIGCNDSPITHEQAQRDYAYALHKLTLAESMYHDAQKILYIATQDIYTWQIHLTDAESTLRDLGLIPPDDES